MWLRILECIRYPLCPGPVSPEIMMNPSPCRFICFAVLASLATLACSDDDSDPVRVVDPQGAIIYAVDTDNNLVRFGAGNPGESARRRPLTGTSGGELILGIDFRPRGGLQGVGSSSRIFRIDTAATTATLAGAAFAPVLNSGSLGFDFNPVVDRIRIHTEGDQNLRIVPFGGTGGTVGTATADTALTYPAPDPGAGSNPAVAGTAYTNSVASATTTELFAIDAGRDVLVTFPASLGGPNSGKMRTVGPLGVDTNLEVGFDIVGSGATEVAYATLTTDGRSRLYTINLTTGLATLIGEVGRRGAPLRSISVVP